MSAVLWRVGKKVPRNLYRGDEPIAMLATAELAAEIAEGMNTTMCSSKRQSEKKQTCGCAGLVEFPSLVPVPGVSRDDCKYPELRSRNAELTTERDALKQRVKALEDSLCHTDSDDKWAAAFQANLSYIEILTNEIAQLKATK
jgi:hypothetical protein